MATREDEIRKALIAHGFVVLPVEQDPHPREEATTLPEVGSVGTIGLFRKQMHDGLGRPTYEVSIKHIWQIQRRHDGPTRFEFFLAFAQAKPRFDHMIEIKEPDIDAYMNYFEGLWTL